MSITEFTKLRVRIIPETPNLGAVVEGINAREPLSAELVAALKEALLRYKVLFFRGQNLNRDEHRAFAMHFGDIYINQNRTDLGRFRGSYDEEGLADVKVVDHFHADVMYMPEGPSFSFLQMLELPEVGGDTMWADLVSSYNDLSQPFREFLETLTVLQGVQERPLSDDELLADHKRRRGEDLTPAQLKELRAALAPLENLPPWEGPLVRIIPETGMKNYWVAAPVTNAIKGLSKDESESILGILFRHQLRPNYVYRWHWGVGDIAFWDHRTTLHSGITDYGTQKRFGNRISIAPNRPIPALKGR